MNRESQYIWILNGISLMLTSGVLAGTLLENVALNKQADQSSQDGNLAAGGAVDGNTDVRLFKRSCSSTLEEPNPWWRVDLENVYNINAIKITQRDLSESLLIGGEIWIGNDKTNIRCVVIPDIPGELTFYYSFKAIKGRYVTVSLPGILRTLSLCEVEVFTVDFVHPIPNVALKAVATQSSTLASAIAPRAIDGRRHSIYSAGSCSHTAENTVDPWWRLDLGQTYIITFVKVTNRGDCCAERLDGAEILIGNSLENNGNDNPRCASILHIGAGKTNTYYCDGGSLDGRFVNVIIPGQSKTLTLCEVEVYGTPTPVEPLLNVALKKPTDQAFSLSIFGWASHVVSGCRSGHYWGLCCSETFPLFNPWWTLDLLAAHKVKAVSVLNRRDCCANWLTDAEIRIGSSPVRSDLTTPRCGSISSTAGQSTFNFQCDGMEGRYLVVALPRFGILSLCEVEVFASLAAPAPAAPLVPAPTPPPPSESLLLNGRYVTLVGEELCWSDALFFCRRHHWDLLSLRSEAEQSAVEQLLGGSALNLTDNVWLGLRRYMLQGRWFWMSGDAMPFAKWPQNIAPGQHGHPCGGVARGERFQWAGLPCNEPLNFLCQSDAMWGAQRVHFESTLMDPFSI